MCDALAMSEDAQGYANRSVGDMIAAWFANKVDRRRCREGRGYLKSQAFALHSPRSALSIVQTFPRDYPINTYEEVSFTAYIISILNKTHKYFYIYNY